MNYGVISDVVTPSEVAIMRGKRILNNNMYSVSQCEVLATRLRHGDVVTIASVNIFDSIPQFVLFAKAVVSASANLKILEQPYLQVGNGKYWRDAIIRDIDYRMKLEKEMIMSMLRRGVHMDNNARVNLAKYLAKFDLAVMANNYSTDGILRRG